MNKPPFAPIEVQGKAWTLEARVIVALMNRLGATEIVLTNEEVPKEPQCGLLLDWLGGKGVGIRVAIGKETQDESN